jgi:hypothetical protein
MARHRSSRSGAVGRGAGSKPRGRSPRQARIQIVDTALDLIETLYVHLLLKRSMYAVNPVQQLKLLRRRCEQHKPVMAEREFLTNSFPFSLSSDLHTNFILPEPSEQLRVPPFRLERYVTASGEAYVVTRVMSPEAWGEPIDQSFQKGVIVKAGTGRHRPGRGGQRRPEAGSNPQHGMQRALVAPRTAGRPIASSRRRLG